MGVMVETHMIQAHLLVQGTSYPMLEELPQKHANLHFLLRDNVFQFQIVYQGFSQPIIVGKQSFAILPLIEPYELEVKFLVEEFEQKEEPKGINIPVPNVYVKEWSPSDPIVRFE